MISSRKILTRTLLVSLLCLMPICSYAQETDASKARKIKKQVRSLLKSGTARFDGGDLEIAATCFDSVFLLDSVNPDAAYYLARINLAKGDTAGTVASLKEAVVNSPRSFRLKRFLARMHLALNEPAEAQKQTDEVLRIRQRDSEALFLKGQAALMLGDSAQAIELLEQALTIIDAKGKK